MTPKSLSSTVTMALAAVAFAAGLAAAGPARAQGAGTEALMDRLDRLERDIRTLNRQIARMPAEGEGAPAALDTAPVGEDTPSAPTPSAPAPQVEFLENEGTMSRVLARLDALEREVRTATGAAESLSYRISQLGGRLDKLLVDLDFRLSRLEGANPGSFSAEARGLDEPRVLAGPAPVPVTKAGAMPPVGAAPQGARPQGTVAKDGAYVPGENETTGTLGTVFKSNLDQIVSQTEGDDAGGDTAATQDVAAAQPQAAPQQPQPVEPQPAQEQVQQQAQQQAMASVLPEGTVQEQYRFAFDLTRQARFDEAEEAFKAFLQIHPDEDLANNARYWLAETYYVRKRYMEAAQAFFDAYKQAPQGPKAPDSLLKLGMSMAGLDKPQEACATFGKLRKEFSPLKTNIEQALNREVKRLECK